MGTMHQSTGVSGELSPGSWKTTNARWLHGLEVKKSKVGSALCEAKGRHCKNSKTTSLGGGWPVMGEAVYVNRLSRRKLAEVCEKALDGL